MGCEDVEGGKNEEKWHRGQKHLLKAPLKGDEMMECKSHGLDYVRQGFTTKGATQGREGEVACWVAGHFIWGWGLGKSFKRQ